jgi:hypothetical protein
MQDEARGDLAQAWYQAAWSRAKRLPPLERVVRKPVKVRDQKDLVKKMAGMFGVKIDG